MIVELEAGSSARRMVCAVWQSLQTGSGFVECETLAEWMLCSNCSWIPWWHRPQVAGTLAGLTLDSGSVVRQDRCARCGSRCTSR